MVKRNKLFYGDNLEVMTTAKRIAIFAFLVLSLKRKPNRNKQNKIL
jgi:hypothetical protein